MFAGLFVQWFWGQVDAVRPGDCARFGVDGDLGEVSRVVQGRQDAGPVLNGEIDVACERELPARPDTLEPSVRGLGAVGIHAG